MRIIINVIAVLLLLTVYVRVAIQGYLDGIADKDREKDGETHDN